ncbi:MAG: DNA-processing protein DprA [Anaerolineales bacterium]|nr:DNA-processing protein DprA [Anaerolineales bacterium]
MDKKNYWIGFNHVPGIGPVRLQYLLDHFGSIERAWHACGSELTQAGLSGSIIDSLLRTRNTLDLEEIISRLDRKAISVVTWNDKEYPGLLKEIDAPPPLLYIQGRITEEDLICVAVVGTRRPTAYGRAVTEDIVTSLATAGVTIVSGMARGIDAVAHKACLKAGGRTIAVLGSGLEHIYPQEHSGLAKQIVSSGAVISDYPPDTKPEGRNFPPRNRIISGLSRSIIVTEAGVGSGALITASFAADQGREVFAVPGSIYSQGSIGPHQLIADGANILTSAEEVLDLLNLEKLRTEERTRVVLPENEVEKCVWQCITSQPSHIDEIRMKCKLPVQQTTAALTMLEMKGRIRQVGPMIYVRIR